MPRMAQRVLALCAQRALRFRGVRTRAPDISQASATSDRREVAPRGFRCGRLLSPIRGSRGGVWPRFLFAVDIRGRSRVSPPPPTRSRKGIRVSQQRRAWRPLRGSRLARLNHCPARAQRRPVGGWAQQHASGSVLRGSFWPCTAAESVYLVWEGSELCGSWSARERVVPGATRVSAG
jgi:hypothetical protein